MIHARAPQRILIDAVEYHTSPWAASGERSFADFVNKHCSHLVLSMTNSIKVNSSATQRYRRLRAMLELYDVPIVIFGLGVRSPVDDLSQASIPQDAIDVLRYMETRCGPIGVRGEFTAKVFRELAGVRNVVVTGCPSFFSEPKSLARLRRNLAEPSGSTYSYAGTRYDRPQELAQLLKAVHGDGYYIETTSAENHRAHLQAMRGEDIDVPAFLRNSVRPEPNPAPRPPLLSRLRGRASAPSEPNGVSMEELRSFYRNRYRLFRNPEDWLQFNREVISYGFGARFHVNMATILSAKPATWITHDTRTQEFCDFLHLPHVTLDDSADMEPEDFRERATYEETFDHVNGLFDNFRGYLDRHGLRHRLPQTVI